MQSDIKLYLKDMSPFLFPNYYFKICKPKIKPLMCSRKCIKD